jgi:ribosomal protein L11 methylase PrmA
VPGGAAILSGFLQDAVQGLVQAYQASGLTVLQVEEDGVWRAMVCGQA